MQMLEFIRANPTPPIQCLRLYWVTGRSPALTAIFDIINPTLEFCVQDFSVATNYTAAIKSLASASIVASVYRMSKPEEVEVLIAALPSFKAEEITFNQCDFHGYTTTLFRTLACTPSICRVNCWPAHLTFSENFTHLEHQFKVRIAMFALLHARKRSHGKMRRLPLEMYRMVAALL